MNVIFFSSLIGSFTYDLSLYCIYGTSTVAVKKLTGGRSNVQTFKSKLQWVSSTTERRKKRENKYSDCWYCSANLVRMLGCRFPEIGVGFFRLKISVRHPWGKIISHGFPLFVYHHHHYYHRTFRCCRVELVLHYKCIEDIRAILESTSK